MSAFRVVAWNVNQGAKGDYRPPLASLDSDIALLTEMPVAMAPPGAVFEPKGTKRRDRQQPATYAAAVVSPHQIRTIEDAQASFWGKPKKVPFENSRPGSWHAAVVEAPGSPPLTAVSIYGLMDEMSDASVHRSLSDLSPLFDDDR